MFLQLLTEHQAHIFGGILVLAVLFFGLLGVLIFPDKRCINTHLSKPKTLSRRQKRLTKKSRRKS